MEETENQETEVMSQLPPLPAAVDEKIVEETDPKAENFKRIAQTRTNEIIRKIQTLGNLSNHYTYHYTPEQVKIIFDGISAQVEKQRKRFLAGDEDDSDLIRL